MLNFEKLLEEIGEFGNYQKYAIFLLQALDLDKLAISTVSSADASVGSGGWYINRKKVRYFNGFTIVSNGICILCNQGKFLGFRLCGLGFPWSFMVIHY